MPGERILPVEKFRLAVCHAFPEYPQLAKASVGASIGNTWLQLAGVLGMSIPVFARKLAERTDLEVARSLKVSPRVLTLLPPAGVRKYPCLPLRFHEDELEVAVANPWDEELIQFVHFATNARVQLLLAPPEKIGVAIQIACAALAGGTRKGAGVLMPGEGVQQGGSDQDAVLMAHRLLHEVSESGASDLHVQPFLGGGVARARIDGLLRRIALLPEPTYRQLCRYFKANGGMDPGNDRVPQDGRMSINVAGHDYELRLSSLPSRGGERIVIRFLDQGRSFHLANNGFSVAEVHLLRRLIHRQSGLILLTGPIGSGKTSTLYALLGELNAPHRNIITVENPVEYDLPGLSQIDISEGAGLNFARVLRSALSQDPDVLLVGEIDDRETAEIVCQAALTGHLVLSTLYTNDALGAISRLLDLGIQPSVLADILAGVISQRLCRRLCKHCRMSVNEDSMRPEESAFRQITRVAPSYRPMGCEHCGHTGFRGRLPVTGILEPSSSLRQAIASNRLHEWLSGRPELNSPSSLSTSAVRHIVAGDTSVGESVRVIGIRFWSDLAAEYQTAEPEVAFVTEESESGGQAPGVLLLGPGGEEEDRIAAALEKAWFSVFRARTSVDARDQLQAHMNIVYVVASLDEHLGNEELLEYVHRARVDLYWSRLPAVMLLPANRPGLEEGLVADGSTVPCVIRPVSPEEVVRLARGALSSSHGSWE